MDAVVHPKERLDFGVCLVVSLLIYLLLVISIIRPLEWSAAC